MTDEELAAVKERAEKMTPESWSQVLRSRKDTLDLVAEVARQQGIIDRARALATLNGQRPDGRSEQGWIGVVSAVALLAILDGEEQS